MTIYSRITIVFLVVSILSCVQDDKAKKQRNFLIGAYFWIRTLDRYSFGEPICGGDPLGTSLGLNNDIKPSELEVGRKYFKIDNNTNIPKNKTLLGYLISNRTQGKMISVSLTYTKDCFDKGFSTSFRFFFGFCNGSNFTSSLDPILFSCTNNLPINLVMVKAGTSEVCNTLQNFNQLYLRPSTGDCNYEIFIQEI
ncbi:MAG: hypothetical protein SFU98_04835 [Leptospiraceae bacterium]|nr:hypothetical protein [Leptospiraceae bacterium]